MLSQLDSDLTVNILFGSISRSTEAGTEVMVLPALHLLLTQSIESILGTTFDFGGQ